MIRRSVFVHSYVVILAFKAVKIKTEIVCFMTRAVSLVLADVWEHLR
jgi:hypothetical protein